MIFPRPSLAGRQIALRNKWQLNAAAAGYGPIGTLTGLGSDALPWDTDECTHHPSEKCSGKKGCRAEWIYRTIYNTTFPARQKRLHDAAAKHADRYLRKVLKYGGPLGELRLIGWARGPQLRGVLHVHLMRRNGVGEQRALAIAWSRAYWNYIQAVCKRERAQYTEQQRMEFISREYFTGEITRGVYGFGFEQRGHMAGDKGARYMGRNAAGYMAANAAGESPRHYVSNQLTARTGATMRVLRGVNWLWVRRRLIAQGELQASAWLPTHWDETHRGNVLRVWNQLHPSQAP